MRRLLHVAGLATILFSQIPAAAQTRYTCGSGVVRAVASVTETVVRETTTTERDEAGDVMAIVLAPEQRQRRSLVVTVQLGDRLYTSAPAGDPNGTLDLLRLADGDAIDVCVNGVQIVLERQDCTDYRGPLAGNPVELHRHESCPAGAATRWR